MKILKHGYEYEMVDFERDSTQKILFIQKGEEGVTLMNGTTNEEVLKVLIDRLQFLNEKFICRENAIVITKLEESLMWLNKRTEDRKARGVEGKLVK